MRVFDATRPPRVVEALLQSLGADHSFVNDVLGDLAEEYQQRVEWDGARSARWWYLRQALHVAPYLLRDWRRRLGVRGAGMFAASLVSVFAAGYVVDRVLSTYVLTWLTYHTTGIGLNAEINHWLSTGDMFPWVLAYYVCRRTIPAAVAGYLTRFTGRRAPLVHSMSLAAALFVSGTTLLAMGSATLGIFMGFELLVVTPQVMSCIAGGVLGALMTERRRLAR